MEVQLAGRRLERVPPPLEGPLSKLLRGEKVSTALLCLAVRLGSPEVLPLLLSRVQNRSLAQDERVKAIAALGEAGQAECEAGLLAALEPKEAEAIQAALLTALGRYKDESLGLELLARLGSLPSRLRERVLDVLVSRPAWTRQLLAAVAAGRLDPKSVTIEQVRRMLLHGDAAIAQAATARWGAVRPMAVREKQGLILAVTQMIGKGAGDGESGHKLYTKHCATCHKLFGEGNQVGPDLTGADRRNLPVLVPNVVDPSAVIRPEFRAYNVVLVDGRILSGLLAESNDETVAVLDAKNQRTVVKRAEIEEIKASETSLMPDNVLEPFGDQDVRDLFAYLRSK
jgi:putative heme-binding domain-containing protein